MKKVHRLPIMTRDSKTDRKQRYFIQERYINCLIIDDERKENVPILQMELNQLYQKRKKSYSQLQINQRISCSKQDEPRNLISSETATNLVQQRVSKAKSNSTLETQMKSKHIYEVKQTYQVQNQNNQEKSESLQIGKQLKIHDCLKFLASEKVMYGLVVFLLLLANLYMKDL